MPWANLETNFCGVAFRNPFVLAAGPSTDSREMMARGFEAGWAGAVLKTTSVESEEVSIAYPIMSALRSENRLVGLHNIDLISERHIGAVLEDVVWLKQQFPDHRLAVSLVASRKEDWQALIRQAEDAGADLIELSISCPQGSLLENVGEAQGSMISHDPRLTKLVTHWAREAARRVPVYVKLSPGVTDLASIARAVERGGADGVCVIDSVEAIVGVDTETFTPLPSVQGYSSRGGYSGRAVKPIALRCVADIASSTRLPIAGVGGIYTWRDAAEFLLVGATLLQVCTAVMQQGFGIVRDLCDGLSRWLDQRGVSSCREVIGQAVLRLRDHEGLPHGIPVRASIQESLCIGCGLCHVACFDGGHCAIEWNARRRPRVLEESCVGCGLCPQVCPVPGCITMQTRWSYRE